MRNIITTPKKNVGTIRLPDRSRFWFARADFERYVSDLVTDMTKIKGAQFSENRPAPELQIQSGVRRSVFFNVFDECMKKIPIHQILEPKTPKLDLFLINLYFFARRKRRQTVSFIHKFNFSSFLIDFRPNIYEIPRTFMCDHFSSKSTNIY